MLEKENAQNFYSHQIIGLLGLLLGVRSIWLHHPTDGSAYSGNKQVQHD